jgi:hypothetical protein
LGHSVILDANWRAAPVGQTTGAEYGRKARRESEEERGGT